MDDVYGEVVAAIVPDDVVMTCDRRGSRVRASVKFGSLLEDGPAGCHGNIEVGTDFETARRMVDGEVSILVVVSDGGES